MDMIVKCRDQQECPPQGESGLSNGREEQSLARPGNRPLRGWGRGELA